MIFFLKLICYTEPDRSKISHVNQMTRYAELLFHKVVLPGYTYNYYIANGSRKGFYTPLCQVLVFSLH